MVPVTKRSDVLWISHTPASNFGLSDSRPVYSSQVLPKGWRKEDGRAQFATDTIWEQNSPIPLRDGTTLYADVFRPADSGPQHRIPALMAWSPFGKSGSGKLGLDLMKYRVGVPRSATSGLENWEAPDPAYWCAQGYALVYPDARGCFHSEGDFVVYGSQEGQDGYDAVEWAAQLPWCTGKIGLVGNSWLTSTQWYIAAQRPPSLVAIAPFEGLGDYYRESIVRGGIPESTFWDTLFSMFGGKGNREDVGRMARKYPFVNDYWLDKKPALGNIDIPMYALMSYSTLLHTEGSYRGFFMSASNQKWLRIHATQEWYDIYSPDTIKELKSFMDHFLKGAENDWELTPKLRLSLLGYNLPNVVNRTIKTYPPPEFSYTRFFLSADKGRLIAEKEPSSGTVIYDSELRNDRNLESPIGAFFDLTFDTYTELCGWSRVDLFMSADTADDMDVFVVLRKLDRAGKPLQSYNIPFESLPAGTTEEDLPYENVFRYIGPNGRLRASHRSIGDEPGLEPGQSDMLGPAYVWHPHETAEKILPGEVYELNIHLWPGGMLFEAGESLRLEVKGFHPIMPEFEPLLNEIENHNRGLHRVHTGPRHPSSILIPLAQPRRGNS